MELDDRIQEQAFCREQVSAAASPAAGNWNLFPDAQTQPVPMAVASETLARMAARLVAAVICPLVDQSPDSAHRAASSAALSSAIGAWVAALAASGAEAADVWMVEAGLAAVIQVVLHGVLLQAQRREQVMAVMGGSQKGQHSAGPETRAQLAVHSEPAASFPAQNDQRNARH
jgi:hypothetical protein